MHNQNGSQLAALMDSEKNIDPHCAKHYTRPPIRCLHSDARHEEQWLTRANPHIGAEELTVQPGQTVAVKDGAAYGGIVIQGQGRIGHYRCEAAGMLRSGQLSADEYFFCESAAKAGVTIACESPYEPLVLPGHFGPNRADMPKAADLGLEEQAIQEENPPPVPGRRQPGHGERRPARGARHRQRPADPPPAAPAPGTRRVRRTRPRHRRPSPHRRPPRRHLRLAPAGMRAMRSDGAPGEPRRDCAAGGTPRGLSLRVPECEKGPVSERKKVR